MGFFKSLKEAVKPNEETKFNRKIRNYFEKEFIDKLNKNENRIEKTANFLEKSLKFNQKRFYPVFTTFCLFEDLFTEINCNLIEELFKILEKHKSLIKSLIGKNEKSNLKLQKICKLINQRLLPSFEADLKNRISIFSQNIFTKNKFSQNITKKNFKINLKNKSDFAKNFNNLQNYMENPYDLLNSKSIDNFSQNVEYFLLNKNLLFGKDKNDFLNSQISSELSFSQLLNSYDVFETVFEDSRQSCIFLTQILIFLQFLNEKFKLRFGKSSKDKIKNLNLRLIKLLEQKFPNKIIMIKMIIDRNKNWLNFKTVKIPSFGNKKENLSEKQKPKLKTILKKDPNDYLFKVWPSQSIEEPILMGNLVLENIWKTNVTSSNPTIINSENFEEKFKRSKKYFCGKSDLSKFGKIGIPSVEKEKQKLQSLVKEG
ncbi:hypothetical protein MHBO_002467, partial [Bonamia ostreae]